jgi:hypothetical protein
MPDVDAILLPFARDFYESLTDPDERRRVDDAIDLVRHDPYIDDDRKLAFRVAVPDFDAISYYGDEFWVIYRFMNEWTLAIINIGFTDRTRSRR